MAEADTIYSEKAIESLGGAASEYTNRRYNNCANRAYYACLQGAVAALFAAGFRPTGRLTTWSHETDQATFVGELIHRRKLYPAEFRDVLTGTYKLRQAADYSQDLVSEEQADRTVRRARAFVAAIQGGGGRRR